MEIKNPYSAPYFSCFYELSKALKKEARQNDLKS